MKKYDMRFVTLIGIICLLVMVVPGSAVKTTEQSMGDSLTRGSRFAVTITGLPNSSYYLWLPHTSSMTGQPRDQPPVIAESQMNVMEDPADGPYPIGSYRYNNGDGNTIRDDIAPSTPEIPNTRYYALVTTDNDGQATVEFLTSINTGIRSYSVKVESPQSVDSDNLLVELQPHNRKSPVAVQIFTPIEPNILATTPTVVYSQPPVTGFPETTIPVHLQIITPAPTPTQKTTEEILLSIIAAGAAFLIAGKC
jgi:hypothetical protein